MRLRCLLLLAAAVAALAPRSGAIEPEYWDDAAALLQQALPGYTVIDNNALPSAQVVDAAYIGHFWYAAADFAGDGVEDLAVFAHGPEGAVRVLVLHRNPAATRIYALPHLSAVFVPGRGFSDRRRWGLQAVAAPGAAGKLLRIGEPDAVPEDRRSDGPERGGESGGAAVRVEGSLHYRFDGETYAPAAPPRPVQMIASGGDRPAGFAGIAFGDSLDTILDKLAANGALDADAAGPHEFVMDHTPWPRFMIDDGPATALERRLARFQPPRTLRLAGLRPPVEPIQFALPRTGRRPIAYVLRLDPRHLPHAGAPETHPWRVRIAERYGAPTLHASASPPGILYAAVWELPDAIIVFQMRCAAPDCVPSAAPIAEIHYYARPAIDALD